LKSTKNPFKIFAYVCFTFFSRTEKMPLNPREISNNCRLQPLIAYHLAEAEQLLKAKPKEALTTEEQVNLTLIYTETCIWHKVKQFAYPLLMAEANEASALNEPKATALYALGVRKREGNHPKRALELFTDAQALAESD
jgi:hypothetical protein